MSKSNKSAVWTCVRGNSTFSLEVALTTSSDKQVVKDLLLALEAYERFFKNLPWIQGTLPLRSPHRWQVSPKEATFDQLTEHHGLAADIECLQVRLRRVTSTNPEHQQVFSVWSRINIVDQKWSNYFADMIAP